MILPKSAGGHVFTPVEDSLHAIARCKTGTVADHFEAYGEATITGAVNNADLWSGYAASAVQPEPDTAGYALWVESSSLADNGTSATGALTVDVHYLDTSGAQQTTTATLNGQTPVDTGVSDCMFVNDFHVETVGSGLVAAGNVDCTKGSGGAVVSRILAAGNFALSTMRQVPAGKRLYLLGWHGVGVAATAKFSTLRIRSSTHLRDHANAAGVYHFLDVTRVKDFATGWLPFPVPQVMQPLSTIKITAWTSGTNDISGSWRGWIEDV